MFQTYILKLTGFCNLDCTYCYMFNSADRSFERKPRDMAPETAIAALRAIAREARRAGTAQVAIVLHGGEPTLWPLASFTAFFDELARLRAEGLSLDCGLQTNLLKLPRPDLLDQFRQHGVSLGVSLDGPREVNDAARVDFAGRGSYRRILRNVTELIGRGYGDLIGGFLCVADPRTPPAEFLDWVIGLPITRVDLLWPLHFNADHPPWSEGGGADGAEAGYRRHPAYGDWLAELFEAWWRLDRPEVEIRLFQNAVQHHVAPLGVNDDMGALSFSSLVINTDGAVELADYFRTSADGVNDTGYSVLTDALEAVAADGRIAAMRTAADAPPVRCRTCPHIAICQGGTLSGRLDGTGRILPQPSVMCHDHMRFFDVVARRVQAALVA